MFFAVYQANSSRSACTRKGHGSNLVHARAFHTGYSQAHWGFSDCCFEVDKDIRQNTLWKTCARWCHHCWTRRNVALSRVKKNKLWIWKAYRRETGELIDWECGGRDKGTLSKLMERLSRWKVELFCTDNWGVYPEVIVADKLYQSKSQTVYLEQNNGRQRHWFARFRRKSIVVSKTLEMVDLTMALFARFHVNGSWKDIASLFSWHPPEFFWVFHSGAELLFFFSKKIVFVNLLILNTFFWHLFREKFNPFFFFRNDFSVLQSSWAVKIIWLGCPSVRLGALPNRTDAT